jgi:NAD(P)-dependent dehydrogenase (short-subunit alcohol dehydrogenase family)
VMVMTSDVPIDRHKSLGLVLFNAGVMSSKLQKTVDGHEQDFQVNHLSHFLLCHLLLPLLAKHSGPSKARIVVVSSELHRRHQPSVATQLQNLQPTDPYPFMTIYGISKLYNLWFTYALAKQLPGSIICNAVTPGWVPATSLSRNSGLLSILKPLLLLLIRFTPIGKYVTNLDVGSQRVADVCMGEDQGTVTGTYWSGGKAVASNDASYDEAAGQQLWESSCKLTGIDPQLYGK